MVKSKHNTMGFWMPCAFAMLFLVLMISSFSKYYLGTPLIKMQIRSEKDFMIQFGLALIGFVIVAWLIISNVRIIRIDMTNKTLSFQNMLTRSITNYSFSDFDGYIDTTIRHGRGNLGYKAVGFAKDKRIIRRIDSYYYSNFEELRSAITDITYLGNIKFGIWDSLKMILKYQVLD